MTSNEAKIILVKRRMCETCCSNNKCPAELCEDCQYDFTDDDFDSAIEVAILALDDKPIDGDSISRKAVMDILYLDPGIDTTREKMIEALPSVVPKKIKLCPFCGGEAKAKKIHNTQYYYVACVNDACCVDASTDLFFTEEEAISAWNHRVNNSDE